MRSSVRFPTEQSADNTGFAQNVEVFTKYVEAVEEVQNGNRGDNMCTRSEDLECSTATNIPNMSDSVVVQHAPAGMMPSYS